MVIIILAIPKFNKNIHTSKTRVAVKFSFVHDLGLIFLLIEMICCRWKTFSAKYNHQ